MRCDYHVHSEFSDDSTELMENQIEKAIFLNLDEICFTDHVDYGVKKDWDQGDLSAYDINDEPYTNVCYPKYFEKLLEMKSIYGDRISIKQGLEFGVQSITVNQYVKLFDTYKDDLDFILLSIHQIDNKEFWTGDFQKGKSQKEYNEGYYQEMLNIVKQYKDYSVLAHLDLMSRYDENGIYPFEYVEDIIVEILKTVIKDDRGIEFNTSSWRYNLKDTTPSIDILKLYKQLGGQIITIGSDAHISKDIGDHFDEAVLILKDIGFKTICTYEKMKPIFHEI